MQELNRLLIIVGQILCVAEFICQIRCRDSRIGGNFFDSHSEQAPSPNLLRCLLNDFHSFFGLTCGSRVR